MREPIRDLGRLEHILEQIENAQEFVAGKELTSLPVVWSIVHDDLPQLHPYIVQYIEELREVQPL